MVTDKPGKDNKKIKGLLTEAHSIKSPCKVVILTTFEMPTTLSVPIDTTKVASYFSYLPVHIHKDVDAIDRATLEAIEFCAPEGSKERMQALYRHSNPFGNPYALCHGECNIEKLKFFVKVVEMIWIDDGIRSCSKNDDRKGELTEDHFRCH